MKKRMNVRFAVIAAGMIVLLFIAGNALIDGTSQIVSSSVLARECDNNLSAKPPKPSDFVFEGCWAYFPSGPCYDIYRDSAGDYWICKLCLQTKNPGPKTCNRISLETLNRGYWCL